MAELVGSCKYLGAKAKVNTVNRLISVHTTIHTYPGPVQDSSCGCQVGGEREKKSLVAEED